MTTKPALPAGAFTPGSFLPGELEDLTQAMESSLSGEIDMLRVLMRRVFNRMIDEADDLKAWMGAQRAICAATQRVAGLLRMEQTRVRNARMRPEPLSQALGKYWMKWSSNERASVPGCSGYRRCNRR